MDVGLLRLNSGRPDFPHLLYPPDPGPSHPHPPRHHLSSSSSSSSAVGEARFAKRSNPVPEPHHFPPSSPLPSKSRAPFYAAGLGKDSPLPSIALCLPKDQIKQGPPVLAERASPTIATSPAAH
ncbi:hypothetical protein AAC387_Pa02g2787 [Persea americana]